MVNFNQQWIPLIVLIVQQEGLVTKQGSNVLSFVSCSAKHVMLEDLVKRPALSTDQNVCHAAWAATAMSLDATTETIAKNVALVSSIHELDQIRRVFVCHAELVATQMKLVVFLLL